MTTNKTHRLIKQGQTRRKMILAFIMAFTAKHKGVSPSIREIGEAVGLYSTSAVTHQINRMLADGTIETLQDEHGRSVSRGIMIPGSTWIRPGVIMDKESPAYIEAIEVIRKFHDRYMGDYTWSDIYCEICSRHTERDNDNRTIKNSIKHKSYCLIGPYARSDFIRNGIIDYRKIKGLL